MNYIEVSFSITPEIPGKDILVAQLSGIGFESFMEEKKAIESLYSRIRF